MLRRTTETNSRVRYTHRERNQWIEFDQGQRETNEYDAETEAWAAETFDDLERVDESSPEHEALGETGPDVDATSEERTVEDEAAEVVEEIERADESSPETESRSEERTAERDG